MTKCEMCGKEFQNDEYRRYKYCSSDCRNDFMEMQITMGHIKNKMRREINEFRINFDFLRTHFPEKAKKILEQMKKKESKEFIDLALDGFKEIE